MASKYSEAEFDALEKKMENPGSVVHCPRCGGELSFRTVGNSCEVRCATDGCIKETIRGL